MPPKRTCNWGNYFLIVEWTNIPLPYGLSSLRDAHHDQMCAAQNKTRLQADRSHPMWGSLLANSEWNLLEQTFSLEIVVPGENRPVARICYDMIRTLRAKLLLCSTFLRLSDSLVNYPSASFRRLQALWCWLCKIKIFFTQVQRRKTCFLPTLVTILFVFRKLFWNHYLWTFMVFPLCTSGAVSTIEYLKWDNLFRHCLTPYPLPVPHRYQVQCW